MKKNYTEIIVVLDRSGSMSSIKSDTIGGVNQFISDQQRVPGHARWTLAQFDHEYEVLANAVPIHRAKPLTGSTYTPRGQTALYGAIGRTIDDVGRRFADMPESERPDKVVFLIVTDGEENASHECEWSMGYNQHKIKEMINRQSGTYSWQFVYIGANQDAITNAREIGISSKNSLNYTANKVGTRSLYQSLSKNVADFMVGSKSDMSWEPDQIKAQIDADK